ncbi:helix-turn-helix domain-containing protein [Aquimarina longa]|uniref:helix-turn-helix domain-containing protein n=1 Tax=Aquimarina longa TaxID=1080221 RepID=UPI000781CB91|nr:helix-turn-helix domain-containing protein [Aquimarina longa]
MNNKTKPIHDLPISVIVEKVVEKSFDDLNKKVDKLQSSIYKINNEKTYTLREVATIVNRDYYTVRQHILDGILGASKKGKNYTITQEHLNDYLKVKKIKNETR